MSIKNNTYNYKRFEPPIALILFLIGPVYTASILPKYLIYLTKYQLNPNYIPKITWFILTRYAPIINKTLSRNITDTLKLGTIEQKTPLFLQNKGIHIAIPVPPIFIKMQLSNNVWNASILGITTTTLFTFIIPGLLMQSINPTTLYTTGLIIAIGVSTYLIKTTPNPT